MSYSHLTRTDTRTTISSTATADDLPGPGRILDGLLQRLGRRVESFLNGYANRFGLGPVYVAEEIRFLSRYGELTIFDRYSLPPRHLSKREMKGLKKRCDRLLRYVRSNLLSTQLSALDEVTTLAIEDSLIRAIFLECQIRCLEPKFIEPDLLLRSTRALASIQETAIHELWSSTILGFKPDQELLKESLSL
ncbi:hypothetical protein SCHPADRAFT_592790 [Schizopora paradoxa]|uniref:Uncharacterized protein n=1 Tax=Schizopora paradoxa TaxID=27342 RepID=A0A0H2RBM2_9AGAM|nr:hypothetical protein SCHPADRAFT_592790 [Schizopora paradoxa]